MISKDAEIIQSWKVNASPWINAIKTESIESRVLVTNRAILDAIIFHHPQKVLDMDVEQGGWQENYLLET